MSHSLAPTPDISAEPRRPLFSSRYGISTSGQNEHFSRRHTEHGEDACEQATAFRCACPGGSSYPPRCCQRATQEDRLCDACRDWCVAVDGAQVFHRLIDLYGAAS